MSKNEALLGPHFGPYRPEARFGREDGPACASSTHSAMDERPGSALAAGMTRRCFLATAAAGFGMAHVHVVPCEDVAFGAEDNYLLIATDGAYSFHGELPLDEALYGEVMRDV